MTALRKKGRINNGVSEGTLGLFLNFGLYGKILSDFSQSKVKEAKISFFLIS